MIRRALPILLALLCAPPASADWLVLRDGTRIETAGAWRQEGRQVIFTLPGGTLSALPTAEVDLEASAAANAPPAAEAETETDAGARTARRPSVLRLTNKDVGRATRPEEEEGEELEETEEEEAEPESPAEPVRLVSWQSRDSEEVSGLEINGTVRNVGEGIATNIVLTVKVRDVEGEEQVTTRAFLAAPSLAPGKSSAFRALLPDVFSLPVDPEFTIESDGFSVQGEAGASPVPEESEEPEDGF